MQSCCNEFLLLKTLRGLLNVFKKKGLDNKASQFHVFWSAQFESETRSCRRDQVIWYCTLLTDVIDI